MDVYTYKCKSDPGYIKIVYRGGRSTAYIIVYLGTLWMLLVRFTLRPHYPSHLCGEKSYSYALNRRLAGSQSQIGNLGVKGDVSKKPFIAETSETTPQGRRVKSKGPEFRLFIVLLVKCVKVARNGRDLEGSSGGTVKVIGKGTVHPITGHEGPEGE